MVTRRLYIPLTHPSDKWENAGSNPVTRTMKICAMSDLHGREIAIPKCDVLAIAGDISKIGEVRWFNEVFIPYLKSYKTKYDICFLVFGNHDDNLQFFRKDLNVPEYVKILNDTGFNYKGHIFYGSPWSLRSTMIKHSLNTLSKKSLKKIFQNINPHTDVLITHTPPYGIGDTIKGDSYHLGSESLLERIREVKPKIHIFGHIHTGQKWTRENGTDYFNVSVLDDRYELAYKPTIITV